MNASVAWHISIHFSYCTKNSFLAINFHCKMYNGKLTLDATISTTTDQLLLLEWQVLENIRNQFGNKMHFIAMTVNAKKITVLPKHTHLSWKTVLYNSHLYCQFYATICRKLIWTKFASRWSRKNKLAAHSLLINYGEGIWIENRRSE